MSKNKKEAYVRFKNKGGFETRRSVKVERRVCATCKVEKEASEFQNCIYCTGGINGRCKECLNKYRKKYYMDKEEYKKTKKKQYKHKPGTREYMMEVRLMRDFRMTIDEYNELFVKQEGRCAICGKHQSEMNKAIHVDHDHVTGEIRGLLCDKCNFGLGMFKDDPELMIKAANYIMKK